MANINASLDSGKKHAEQAARQARPWVEKLARLGYAAKGTVYIIIGVLAVEAAWNGGGTTTNSQGALGTIVGSPFGQFLLGLLTIGLAGYALWRFVEAGLDSEDKGSSSKGIATRVGYVLSGIAYSALAYTAFQLTMGGAPRSNGSTQDWTARLLAQPFGAWLVGLVGLVVIGIGIAQIIKGFKADVREKLSLDTLNDAQRKGVILIGQWGYMARGVVFSIIGGFLVEAAVHSNASQAKGLGSALDLLARQPYGPWLLGIVAVGLVAYGIFMFVEARFRRIKI